MIILLSLTHPVPVDIAKPCLYATSFLDFPSAIYFIAIALSIIYIILPFGMFM